VIDETPAPEPKQSSSGSSHDGAVKPLVIDAFISYASADVSTADAFVAALEERGLQCWIAPRDVVPGALYADGIARAIDASKAFLLILSGHAIGSRHVGKEIERASSRRLPVIALRIDSAPLTPAFEYFLSESQWIDVQPGRIDLAITKLLEAIRRHVNTPSTSAAWLSTQTVERQVPPKAPAKWGVASGVALLLLGVLGLWMLNRQSTHSAGASSSAERATSSNTPAAAAPPSNSSIAVLAFSDLSADGTQGYFSDGMAEEILNVLAHVKGLRVASRTSSFQFRKSDLGIPAIARKLGVRHILEGSVRKAGDTVRVTAQLIDASTDQHEWSQSFDRPLSTANLFAIQDEVAKNIVDHLAAAMGSGSDISVPSSRRADTASEDAYDLYLKGRALFIARTRENLAEAERILRTAVAKDANFARAWEMLGAVLVTDKYWNVGDENAHREGAEATEQALRLDPGLSLAYAVRGEVQLDTIVSRGVAGWEESAQSFSQAIEHDGTNATAYSFLGSNDASLGYLDRAIQDYERCLEIDPAYELCRRKIAALYLYLGRTADGLRLYQLGLENGYLTNDIPFAPVLAARGDRFGALSILAAVYRDEPQVIRPLYRALTDPTFSDRDRKEVISIIAKDQDIRAFASNALWMLKAYDRILAVTVYPEPPIWWAREDPVWLKSESRKQAMQHWHLPEYWRKHGFPPQCRPLRDTDFECQ
jgi:adenylate cyclase